MQIVSIADWRQFAWNVKIYSLGKKTQKKTTTKKQKQKNKKTKTKTKKKQQQQFVVCLISPESGKGIFVRVSVLALSSASIPDL